MNAAQTNIDPALLQLLQRLPQTSTFDEHWFLQQVHLFTQYNPREILHWALMSGHLELRGISISGSWELAVRNSAAPAPTRPLLYTPDSHSYQSYTYPQCPPLPPAVRTYLSTARFSCYDAPGSVVRLTLKQLAARLDEASSDDHNLQQALRAMSNAGYEVENLLPYVDFSKPWRRQTEFPIDAFRLDFKPCVRAGRTHQVLINDICINSHLLFIMTEPVDNSLSVVFRVPEGYANSVEARQVLPDYCAKRFHNLLYPTMRVPNALCTMGTARPSWLHPGLQ